MLLRFLVHGFLISLNHAVHFLQSCDLGLILDAQPEILDQLLHFSQLTLELNIGLLGRLKS